MLTMPRPTVALYVDRTNQQWVVRDSDGNYWVVPAVDSGWAQREPYELTDKSELEPVPTHYKYLLDLPF
jgi:hypothetical protein